MAKLANVNMSLCAPAAYPGVRTAFGPAIRQRFKCAEVALTSGVVYGAVSLPKGFVVRSIGLKIRTASTVSNAALAIGLDQTTGGNQIIYKSGVSLATAGSFVVDASPVSIVMSGAPVLSGTVVVETGALTNVTAAVGNLAGAATVSHTLAEEGYTLTITPTGAINDADFDVVVMGDQLFDVDDEDQTKQWPV